MEIYSKVLGRHFAKMHVHVSRFPWDENSLVVLDFLINLLFIFNLSPPLLFLLAFFAAPTSC